jgi:hypothetical protein
MQPVGMGIVPGPLATRILVVDGLPHTLLTARLPHTPRHPRAVATLAEALALWVGRRVHVALAAAGPGSFCATTGWLDTFEAVTRPQPLVAITCVAHDVVPADPRPGEGLGDFEDVRALLRRTVAR